MQLSEERSRRDMLRFVGGLLTGVVGRRLVLVLVLAVCWGGLVAGGAWGQDGVVRQRTASC